jgi:sulfatase maturation enzyme AslB (radical SAM superfamily)
MDLWMLYNLPKQMENIMKPVQDDHLLLNNIINSLMHKKKHGATVELIIRPECNQQCKYCYLKQYGHESYPIRANKE